MASVTENIVIRIREDGSRVVVRNVKEIGEAADKSDDSLLSMKNALLALASGATLLALANMADQFTNLQNRLRLVTTDSANLARVTKELGQIANDTRSDFSATAELYARMATSSKELGLSQRELLDFTKSLNQAVILSGASAEEAAGGIRQLSQGMASGTLRGDELNSVLENLPAVADVIAKGLGVTRGELRKMGADGKLAATDIVEAFKQAKDELETGFATTVPTLGQAFTVLKNNFMIYVGELDKSYGITAGLASLMITLSSNIDTLVPVLAGIGGAIATAFAPGIIIQFMGQIRALWALMLANPFVALAAVIVGVTTALYMMRDQIKLGIDETTTLGDFMRAAWEGISEVIRTVATVVGEVWDWINDKIFDVMDSVTGSVEESTSRQESWWLGLLRKVAQVFDMIGGVIRGTMAGVGAFVQKIIDGIGQNFAKLGEAVKAAMSGNIADAWESFSSNTNVFEGAGEAFGAAFQAEILRQDDNGLESVLDGVIDRAKELGKIREDAAKTTAELAGGGNGTIKPPIDEEAVKKAARELAKLKNELDGLLGSLNPVIAAERQLAEAKDILTRAVAKNLITQQEANEALEELKFQLQDQLDPLGALNREMDVRLRLLKLSNEQAEIESNLLRSVQSLRQSGIKLTEDEVAGLRAKLVVEQELNRIAKERDRLESESSGRKMRDTGDTITAMQQVKEAPGGNFTSGDQFNQVNQSLGGILDNSQGSMEAQIEQQALLFEQLQAFRDADLISEEAYQAGKLQLWMNTQSIQLQGAQTFFGSMAQLSKSENKKLAAIGKAAAIAQTVINTYQSATSAYASLASIPYVGPFLGAAAAAAAVAAGMANVQAIRSQSTAFRTGGEWTVGGHGGVDSQMVNFRASPGEKISVNTPAQARALERAGEDRGRGSSSFTQNLTIVQQGRPDRRTTEQEARATRKAARKEYERSGS